VFSYLPYRIPNKEPFLQKLLRGKFREATVPLLQGFKDSVDPKYDIEYTKQVLNDAPIFSLQSPFEKRKSKVQTEVHIEIETQTQTQTQTHTQTTIIESESIANIEPDSFQMNEKK